MKIVKSVRSFFKVSVLFESKYVTIRTIIDVLFGNFPKKVKKVCFQNGNTICEHNFYILKRYVTGLHKIFWI